MGELELSAIMPTVLVYGDGVHDDTDALQAHIDGKAELVFPSGEKFIGDRGLMDDKWGNGRAFRISKALKI